MGEVNSTFLCAADFHTADAGGGEVLGKGGGGVQKLLIPCHFLEHFLVLVE